MRAFHQNDRKVDIDSPKRSYPIEFRGFLGRAKPKIYGSSQIPVVMHVFGLAQQMVANSSLAATAGWELFSPNHDRLVRQTMAIGMLDKINAAYRSQLARLAN